MEESTKDRVKFYGTVIGILAGLSIVAVKLQDHVNEGNITHLKDTLPNDADRIIDKIRQTGFYTTQDKLDFIAAIKTYAKEHGKAWHDMIKEANRRVDGAPILNKYGIETGYLQGPIEKFIQDVAEELAKEKDSSLLFSPDSFQTRIAKNESVIPRRRG